MNRVVTISTFILALEMLCEGFMFKTCCVRYEKVFMQIEDPIPKKLIRRRSSTTSDLSVPRDEASKEIKYKTKDLIRSPGGIPIVPVKATRLMSNSIKSGGSRLKQIQSQGQERVKELINPNRLRIIGGTAKGKKIDSPDVYLRPMMAKVREALFSTLTYQGLFTSNTTNVLDVFSGSGSVGLEALSRGAAHTVFVDLSPDCVKTALRNADNCGFTGQASAVCAPAEEVLKDPAKYGLTTPFQLVSITPPYEEVIYNQLIEALCVSPLVVEDTIIVLEYPVELKALPYVLGDNYLFGLRNRRYGRTVLGMYVCRPTKTYDMRPDEFMSL